MHVLEGDGEEGQGAELQRDRAPRRAAARGRGGPRRGRPEPHRAQQAPQGPGGRARAQRGEARRARRDEDRAEVNEMIRAALADDDDAGLKAALKAAKGAELLGADGAGDDGDEPWCTKLVADAMRRSHAAKQKRDDDKERLKHAAGLASHDVRRKLLYRALSDAVPCERSLRAALAAQYNAAEPLD